MSDTQKLDFEARQRAQQLYEECCENPEDFAYKFVGLEAVLAAAQTRIAELERQYDALFKVADRFRDGVDWVQTALQAEAERDAARAEAEALRADAERYRFQRRRAMLAKGLVSFSEQEWLDAYDAQVDDARKGNA